MTNKERQKSLDKMKWLASEDMGFDRSGTELWCDFCQKQRVNDARDNWTCTATQEEREGQCLCATAYNRMQRERR